MQMIRFNSNFIRCLSTCLFLTFTSFAQQPTAQHLSLSALIKQAEQIDLEYLTTQKTHEINRYNSEIAMSGLLPQAESQFSFPDVTKPDQWTLNVQLSQKLYNLPDYHYWEAAHMQSELVNVNLKQAHTNLRKDIILQWLDFQLKVDVLDLLYTREKTLTNQLKIAQILADAGNVTISDVLSASANLANIQAQIQQAKYNISIAQYALQKRTHNKAKAQKLILTETTLPPLDIMETWWVKIQNNNLALQILKKDFEIQQKNYEATSAAVYPKLSLVLQSTVKDELGNHTETLGLTATQSLWTSGLLTFQEEKLLNQLASVRLAKQSQEETLKQNVFRILGQMNTHIAQMQALTKAQQSSDSLLETTIVGYKNGVSTYNEVLFAEEVLFDIQSQQRQVIFNYIMNLVELHALNNSLGDVRIVQLEDFFSK